MSGVIETSADDLAAKRAQFEAEKMSRRQALKRFGIRSAGAVFAAFTVDDLARVVVARMEKEKVMVGMTDGIAKEFKNAGVAFAGAIPNCPPPPLDETDCTDAGGVSAWCSCINHQRVDQCLTCCRNTYESGLCSTYLSQDERDARAKDCRSACSNPAGR